MVIAPSRRYCRAAINHSLSGMLSSCCNKPAIVWSKVLLFVTDPPPNVVSGCGVLWMDDESMRRGAS